MMDKMKEECDCNEGYGPSVDCGRCGGTGEVDKIREQVEFVEWLKNHKMYNPMESCQSMQKMFRVFIAVNKARDEEILQLTSRVAVAEGKVEEQKGEIKKLRDALERIVTDYNQHLNYDNFPECTVPWFANRAQYLAREALKD